MCVQKYESDLHVFILCLFFVRQAHKMPKIMKFMKWIVSVTTATKRLGWLNVFI